MNPNAEETYRILGLTLALEGQLDEALRLLRETVAMPDAGAYSRATLAYVLGRMGQGAEAQAILAELEARAATEYISPVAFATIFIGLADYDRALDWTEKAVDARRGWVAYLNVNPILDPMRGHPKFEMLVKRMQLPTPQRDPAT